MNKIPLSILIPCRNEEKNIARCLEPIADWADEIVVVDSQSTDRTQEIVESYGAKFIQFEYTGGWPKKRQWALDNFSFRNDWILLLDSDEIILDDIKAEMEQAISSDKYDAYWIRFQIYFLGRMLKYGDTELWKLSLFRKGLGKYEKRMNTHDTSMADIEIHEHVVVDGTTSRLKNPVKHENINTLSRYIDKHNEYSNWEANLYFEEIESELKASFWGNQAQRRRWLKKKIINMPFSYFIRFGFLYFIKLGFLDGRAGFFHAGLKTVQYFHIKAKIYEKKLEQKSKKEVLPPVKSTSESM